MGTHSYVSPTAMQLVALAQDTLVKNPSLFVFGTATTDQVVPSQDSASGTKFSPVSALLMEPTATQSMEIESVHDTLTKSAVSPRTGVETIDQLNPFQVSTRTEEPALPTATQSVELTHETPTRMSAWPLVLGLGTIDHTCPFQDSVKVVEDPVTVPTAMQKFGPVQETPRSWPPPGVAAAAERAGLLTTAATGAATATARATTSPSATILGAGLLECWSHRRRRTELLFHVEPPGRRSVHAVTRQKRSQSSLSGGRRPRATPPAR